MVDPKDNPDNPKQRYGEVKPSMKYVSPIGMVWLAEAMREGAEKYGAFNWREKSVEALTYVDACKRHLDLWASGEDLDPVTGIHHLGYAMACCNIVIDAQHIPGTLIDNRHKDNGVLSKLMDLRTKINTEKRAHREAERLINLAEATMPQPDVPEVFKPVEPAIFHDPAPVDLDQVRRDHDEHRRKIDADVAAKANVEKLNQLEDIANG